MRSKVRSPGDEQCRVVMTRVTVVQLVMTLLPHTEVMKRRSGVEVYLGPFLRRTHTIITALSGLHYFTEVYPEFP